MERKDYFDGKPLEEVADFMARQAPNGLNDNVARAEFLLRQTKFIERQTLAVEQTARDTATYTRYMFWSVVVLAVSSVSSLLVQLCK